jgi:hypothetical protein
MNQMNSLFYVQPIESNLEKYIIGKNLDIDLSKNLILTADFETITLSVDNSFIQEIESKKNITREKLKEKKLNEKKKKFNKSLSNFYNYSPERYAFFNLLKDEEKRLEEKKTELLTEKDSNLYLEREKINNAFKDLSVSKIKKKKKESENFQKGLFSKKEMLENKDLYEEKDTILYPISYSICFSNVHKIKTIPLKYFKSENCNNNLIVNASDLLMENFVLDVFEIIFNFMNENSISYDYFLKNVDGKKLNFVCYFHNLGRFDGFFLLKSLYSNPKLNKLFDLKKNLKVLNVNGIIYKIKIFNLTFLDSFLMTRCSLNNLGIMLFNKSKIDLDLSNTNYDQIRNIFIHKNSYRKFRQYNLFDSTLLYDCMNHLRDEFYDHFQIDLSNSVTSSSLAKTLFCKKYYKFNNQIFLFSKKLKGKKYFFFQKSDKFISLNNINQAIFITNVNYERFIRNSFYGGRTEVYKPKADKKFLYIDVNSLYPFGALAPIPYGPAIYKEIRLTTKFNQNFLNRFYGFLKIQFCSPPDLDLLPVLPRKHPANYNVYALGYGEGWYFCKEVQLAFKQNYKITILETIEYKPFAGFKKVIKDLYKERISFPKKHPNNLMIKLILNSLCYGNWGVRADKAIFEAESFDDDFIWEYKKSFISKNSLIKHKINQKTLIPTMQSDLVYDARKLKNLNQSIHISSAVTSQTRVTMYPFLNMLYKKNLLYYSDTDSIILDYEKGKPLIEKRINPSKIGYFKIECESTLGYFLDKKFYYIKNDNNNVESNNNKDLSILKSKGIDSKRLEKMFSKTVEDEFENILKNHGEFSYKDSKIERLQRNSRSLLLKKIELDELNISNLNFQQYRKKVVDSNKNWTTTKSLILNDKFEEISFLELKNHYNNFESNII